LVKNEAGVASLIEAAQINALFSRARLVYSVNVVNSAIVAIFLWNVVSAALLLTWLAAVVGITAIRFRLLLDYDRDGLKADRCRHWKRVAVWGATASGIVWGLAAIFLFPHGALLQQVFLVVVIIGMMAGSVTSWNAYFPAFQAYFLPVALLTLCRFVLEIFAGETREMFAALGAMFMVFTAGLYVFARKSSLVLPELLTAKYEKEASDDRYRALFQGAQVPMLLIDPSSGLIVDANDAATGYYGYAAERLKEMNISQVNTLSREEIAAEMSGAAQKKKSCFHFRHRLANGEVRDVEVHSGPINLGEQRLLYSIVHDITERKLAEAEIVESRRIIDSDRVLFQAILDNAPLGMWFLGADGKLKFINKTFCEAVGIPEAHFLSAKHYSEVLPEAVSRNCMKSDQECFAQDAPHHSLEKLPFVDGKDHLVEITKVKLFGKDGEVRGLIGLAADATERKQAEESMKLASLIYQSNSEAIMVTDERNHIVEVNPAFTAITGYTLEEVSGKTPRLLQSGKHDKEFYRQMWRAILAEGGWQGELWNRRKDGGLYAQWSNVSVIRHPDGGVHRFVAQFSDITEKKQKDEIIWRQANYDTLTGLPNRRLFRDRLEREIKKSHRTAQALALLFIDLDRFKEINDTMGHDRGDQLLVEVALRIGQCLRETDTIARLGGDEFTVILTGFDSRVHIERIAQNIINELARPFMLGDDAAYISASIGLTLYPDDATDMESLLKNADQAMYGAKSKGRNRFGYFTESMQREAQEKFALTNDLRLALIRGELEVYYQPIVEIVSGRIVKAEALLRWNHRERGMIGPDQFIPLAEESGLILEIGDWVFHEAVSSVERWRKKFGGIIPVSVNKSPVQFAVEAKAAEWPDRLVSCGLPGNSIAVEITEGMLLEELPMVKQRLLVFHNGGMEVSIDDFGTGFSSLSYLRQFDIDYLKIDRSFISSLAENESDMALAEAIIVMAHKLGIRTIAEGVETVRQRDLLVAFGCDFAQGFLYSRPVPSEEFEKLLEENGLTIA
jgi:diguanylate cyclase (GGDEF)-like protein/PAS domain S-box-containing protein